MSRFLEKHITVILILSIAALFFLYVREGNRMVVEEAAALQEVTTAYVKENNGAYPVTDEYIGAGDYGLIYRMDKDKVLKIDFRLADKDLSHFGIETETGKIYYDRYDRLVSILN